VGSTWVADRIRETPLIDGATATVRFDSTEAISGSSGCNEFKGTVAGDADAIRIAAVATTRRACPPAVMRQERRYLDALGATRQLWPARHQLEFVDESGRLLARFTRLPDDP